MDEQSEDINKRCRTKTESSSESSSSEDSNADSEGPSAPDGGWGWAVVFGSFLCHLLADGFAFSFGVLFKDLLSYFGESKSKTSWIGSLFFGVPMILGPFAGFLTSKYGCRKVTIVGGIVTATGFFVSAFMDSITVLCITFGCVAGIGLSLIYVPAIVVVAFYFEKKRAFATGLAVCGSGLGTFAIAPLTEYLLEMYSWKGAMMIWAGLALNFVLCGALFRPLKLTQQEKFQRALDNFDKLSKTKSSSRYSLQAIGTTEKSDLKNSTEKLELLIQERVSHSTMQLPTYLQKDTGHIDAEKILNELRNNNTSARELLSQFISSHSIPESFDQRDGFVRSRAEAIPNGTHNHTPCKKEVIWRRQRSAHLRRKAKAISNLYNEPMKRQDIFYRGNLVKRPLMNFRASSCPDLHLHVTRSDSYDDQKCNCTFQTAFSGGKKVVKKMVDMSVVRNILFLLFTLSNFILYFWYDVPYVFLVDKAIGDGIPEKEASFLISVAGIVNTAGQILFGFLGDRPNISTAALYSVSTILCGISITLIPICTTYIPLVLMSSFFGLFVSANYSLCTILLVDFVGMNKLTTAYGLLMMNQGIANLIGPPVAGLLYDVSGVYDYSFYSAGLSIVLSGSLVFLCPLLKRFLHDRHRRRQSYSTDETSVGSDPSPVVREVIVFERETVI